MKLHPVCVACRRDNVAKRDIIDKDTGIIKVKKGEFAKKCSGFSEDPVNDYIKVLDPRVRDRMNAETLEKLARMSDPMLWAEDNITVPDTANGRRTPWLPQGATWENIDKYGMPDEALYYQEAMVRCNSQLQAYRIGRRAGKSWSLAIKILHKMYTEPQYKVLLIAPHLKQLDIIFDLVNEYILTSPTLKDGKVRFIKTPNRHLELPNGSFMTGFPSGSEAIRGQSANMIVIDEADYLTTNDLSAIASILSEHKDSILLAASTPSGARENFYEWNIDPEFKAFHFPSMARPIWDYEMEQKQKKLNGYPSAKYDHEILAEFGEIAQGVFQNAYIERAINKEQYSYEDQEYIPGWQYAFGIDWNPVNGTEVYVLGRSPTGKMMKTVAKAKVVREGNTQIQSCNEIIRMNRRWKPIAIYADRGAGSVQIEILKEYGRHAAEGSVDRNLLHIIKAIDFGSKIEMNDPATNEVVKVYAKPAVVESAIRAFENDSIKLSRFDEDLERQLKGYIIEKQNGTRPVYGMIADDIEDHALDAFMLAIFAMTMNFTSFGLGDYLENVDFSEDFYYTRESEREGKLDRAIKQNQKPRRAAIVNEASTYTERMKEFMEHEEILVKRFENGILKKTSNFGSVARTGFKRVGG